MKPMNNDTNTNLTVITGMLLGLILAGPATAQVPQMMSYQGRVTAAGENVDGTGYFKFVLVDSLGNHAYWSNDGTATFPPPFEPDTAVALAVNDGLFSVMLGEDPMDGIHNSVFLFNDAHLRVWFSEDNATFTLLAPDHPIGSVGYAAMAAQVSDGAIFEDQLANSAVTAFKIANSAVTSTKLASGSVTADKIVNGTITSNKIDWSTMPDTRLKGYAEYGSFATAPVASGDHAIAMGHGAVAGADHAVVGGGYANVASGRASTIAGGRYHESSGMDATVGGGYDNTASGEDSTVSGGAYNTATNNGATVCGGRVNTARGIATTVGGGAQNTASTNYATIGGGWTNRASGFASTVAGGTQNLAEGSASTIGGGTNNTATRVGGTVGGGTSNTASGEISTVGGGRRNTASGHNSTAAGGIDNTAGHNAATVGGGRENTASGISATVGGGAGNTASGDSATVGGGFTNTASGMYATIPGGRNNLAAHYAFAAGRRAKANHQGSFVWADSTDADFASAFNNQFAVRAGGGAWFTSGAGGANQTVAWTPGTGSWIFSSDRNLKEGFVPVNPQDVLAKVAALPVTEWNYIGYDQRHIGPVAQDFHAAFPLAGSSDTSINSLHLDGVALAAIQGLYSEVTRLRQEATAWHGGQKSEIERLQAENMELHQKNGELEARLERIEAVLEALAQ